MKKFFALAAVAAFSLCLIVSAARAGEQKKFVYLPQNLNNPFYTTIADTFAELYAKEGIQFTPLDPNNDQSTQISLIEDAVAQGVSAIFITPVNTDGVISGLIYAKNNGVPVVAIDCTMAEGDEDLVVSTVTTDNYDCGYLTAKQIIKDFPNGAKIALIDSPIYTACIDREQGFKAGLAEAKDVNYEIVAQQSGNAALEPSMRVAENMLQANPGIQAFFGINDPTALGIVAVLKAAGRSDIKVYGVDGSPDAKAAIKDGTITSTAAQSPVNMAKLTKEVTDKYLKGEKPENLTLIPTFIIDKSNVDQYGTTGWQ